MAGPALTAAGCPVGLEMVLESGHQRAGWMGAGLEDASSMAWKTLSSRVHLCNGLSVGSRFPAVLTCACRIFICIYVYVFIYIHIHAYLYMYLYVFYMIYIDLFPS